MILGVTSTSTSRELSTTTTTPAQSSGSSTNPNIKLKGTARQGKRPRKINPVKQARFKLGPRWKKPPIIMSSPIAATYHPTNKFIEQEEEIDRIIQEKSKDDQVIISNGD